LTSRAARAALAPLRSSQLIAKTWKLVKI